MKRIRLSNLTGTHERETNGEKNRFREVKTKKKYSEENEYLSKKAVRNEFHKGQLQKRQVKRREEENQNL